MKTSASGRERDQAARQGRMRKRILMAAMKLFLEKGFNSVTMRNIAAEIDYSPGTIYRYFADKDEIFFALRGEGFELFDKHMAAVRRAPGSRKGLRKGLEAYASFALENPEYYDIMFIMRAPIERIGEREEWGRTTGSFDLLREDVRQAIDAGLIRGDNVDKTAFALWSLLHGMLTLILRRRVGRLAGVTDRKLLNQVIGFALDSLLKS